MDIYRGLLDLEVQLANQWYISGSGNRINKVIAGFAKAGVFIIPPDCVDGQVATEVPFYCAARGGIGGPLGENGGDAVIDIDNDFPDEATPPSFHVWTGPAYVFDTNGVAAFPPTPGCNTQFRIIIAEDRDFAVVLKDTGYLTIPAKQRCYSGWPDAGAVAAWKTEWTALTNKLKTDNKDQIYYKVETRDATNIILKDSTQPGSGLFANAEAPYAIVNLSGTPDLAPPVAPGSIEIR